MFAQRVMTSFALAFLIYTPPGYSIEIENFRAGLVCDLQVELDDGADVPVQWICFETETVYITGQGRCIFNRKEKHCTWYGFEFDYTGAAEDDEIICIATSSLPVNVGSPEKIREQDVTSTQYSFTLPPGDGHFYNPQYTVFTVSGPTETLTTSETVCSHNERELYRFRFTQIHPAVRRKDLENSMMSVQPISTRTSKD